MQENKKVEQFKKEIEKLKEKIKELEKQKNEYLKGWQRERADFINYKKSQEEKIKEFINLEKENFVLKFLPILDSFDFALKHANNSKNKQEIEGFLKIREQIINFLKNQGLEEINCQEKEFNPNFMEAVEVIEDKKEKSGKVIEEIQKGYKFNGRLLRPAKVKVVK